MGLSGAAWARDTSIWHHEIRIIETPRLNEDMATRREDMFVFVHSALMTLPEISQLVGIDPDPDCSHSIGDPRGAGAPFKGSLWRHQAEVEGEESLAQQFESLLSIVEKVSTVQEWPSDVAIGIEIAIYSNSPAPTLWLDSELVNKCARYGLGLELCVYMCD